MHRLVETTAISGPLLIKCKWSSCYAASLYCHAALTVLESLPIGESLRKLNWIIEVITVLGLGSMPLQSIIPWLINY